MKEQEGTRSTTGRLTPAEAREALFQVLLDEGVATALRSRGLVIEGESVLYLGEDGEVEEIEITGR